MQVGTSTLNSGTSPVSIFVAGRYAYIANSGGSTVSIVMSQISSSRASCYRALNAVEFKGLSLFLADMLIRPSIIMRSLSLMSLTVSPCKSVQALPVGSGAFAVSVSDDMRIRP